MKKSILITVALLVLTGLAVYFFVPLSPHRAPAEPKADSRSQSGSSEVSPLSEVTSILLVGTDLTAGGEEYTRSDSIMIVSLDPVGSSIKLTSILRDNFVEIPGHDSGRINKAHALGGPELLMDTINRNFALNLTRYVEVDFSAFSGIIDQLGGVDMEISAEESSHVFGALKPAGTYHLTGQQALDYCRIRKIDDDFHRTARQRGMLYSLYHTFRASGEGDILPLIKQAYPSVRTNLGLEDLITLYRQYRLLQNVTLDQMSLPVEDGFEEKSVYGQDVLMPNLERNVTALHQFLYGAEAPIPAIPDPPKVPESAIGDPSWLAARKEAARQAESSQAASSQAESLPEEGPEKETEKEPKEESDTKVSEAPVTIVVPLK